MGYSAIYGNKGMTESATENWIMMSHIDDGDETLLSSYNMYLYVFMLLCIQPLKIDFKNGSFLIA